MHQAQTEQRSYTSGYTEPSLSPHNQAHQSLRKNRIACTQSRWGGTPGNAQSDCIYTSLPKFLLRFPVPKLSATEDRTKLVAVATTSKLSTTVQSSKLSATALSSKLLTVVNYFSKQVPTGTISPMHQIETRISVSKSRPGSASHSRIKWPLTSGRSARKIPTY